MDKCMCILSVLLIVLFVQVTHSKKTKVAKLNLLFLYESEVELSLAVERSARNVTRFVARRWSSELVRILADHRVKVTEVKEATLKENDDQHDACAKDVPNGVEEATTIYLEGETPCTDVARSALGRIKKKIRHASKEVKKWRQGLMFMSRRCHREHPDPEDYAAAVQCLSRQVDTERYDTVITRLIVALEEAQNEFLSETEKAITHLEECIEESFSVFSQTVGSLVANATVCREEEEEEVTTEASEMKTPAPAQLRRKFRFKCLKC